MYMRCIIWQRERIQLQYVQLACVPVLAGQTSHGALQQASEEVGDQRVVEGQVARPGQQRLSFH